MIDYLLVHYLKPIKFHPYTSDTRQIIFKMDIDDEVDKFRAYLVEYFNDEGIKCYPDNKTVFECELNGKKIYYGFYDLKFTIGLDYWSEREARKGGHKSV